MYYTVKARYFPDRMAEFHRKLTDGTIAAQRPDGPEIVASMRRAKITEPGLVEWSEQCFCPTPLQHERRTVYDHYFTDFHTAPAEVYVEFEGKPFMDLLSRPTPHHHP